MAMITLAFSSVQNKREIERRPAKRQGQRVDLIDSRLFVAVD